MLDPERITAQATPADLGIDSLGLVESISAIEEAFDIVIPFNANEPDQSEIRKMRQKSRDQVKGLLSGSNTHAATTRAQARIFSSGRSSPIPMAADKGPR